MRQLKLREVLKEERMRSRLRPSSGSFFLPERSIGRGENATIEVTGSIEGGENAEPFASVLR